jgi:hypothetical protein
MEQGIQLSCGRASIHGVNSSSQTASTGHASVARE